MNQICHNQVSGDFRDLEHLICYHVKNSIEMEKMETQSVIMRCVSSWLKESRKDRKESGGWGHLQVEFLMYQSCNWIGLTFSWITETQLLQAWDWWEVEKHWSREGSGYTQKNSYETWQRSLNGIRCYSTNSSSCRWKLKYFSIFLVNWQQNKLGCRVCHKMTQIQSDSHKSSAAPQDRFPIENHSSHCAKAWWAPARQLCTVTGTKCLSEIAVSRWENTEMPSVKWIKFCKIQPEELDAFLA